MKKAHFYILILISTALNEINMFKIKRRCIRVPSWGVPAGLKTNGELTWYWMNVRNAFICSVLSDDSFMESRLHSIWENIFSTLWTISSCVIYKPVAKFMRARNALIFHVHAAGAQVFYLSHSELGTNIVYALCYRNLFRYNPETLT